MAASKKSSIEDTLAEKIGDEMDKSQTYNPLLVALKENDKKHLFQTNVTTVFHKTGFHLFDYYFGAVINVHDELGKLIGQEARVGQAAGTFNLLIGNSQSGKMEPISTKIPAPVPEGYIKMGDLRIGDKIFTYDGSLTEVDGIFNKGEQDIYKITFGDGRVNYCGKDHLWEVMIYNHGKKVHRVISIEQMMKDYKNFETGSSNRKYHVPTLSAPVQYPHQDVPIDPYTLGALIGNGCLTNNTLSISCGSIEIPEKIAHNNGFIVRCDTKSPYRYQFWTEYDGSTISTKEFFADLPDMVGKKSAEKYIPNIYKYNDYETRMELLRGLMDTDGSITFTSGNFNVTYSSNSKHLLLDIQELIRSLGYNANIHVDRRTEKYRGGFHGTLTFALPNTFKIEMFSVMYKWQKAFDSLQYDQHSKYDYVTVKEIEFSHREKARCIHVTDPRHLYVTDQFIVTHNTTLAAQIAANIIRQYKYANVIHFDCENRFDVSRCETITQLPASYFNKEYGERYMIRTGHCGLDVIQEMVVKTYVNKMKLKHELTVDTGFKDEFGNEVLVLEPTVIIIDSITTVLNETFNPESAREAADAEKMRSNTEGARDAKTLKGFFKDVIPLCKEANIIIYGINHINQNMSMNAFLPVAKQQNYLKQDEIIPGGKTMIYYPFNIIKLTAKPSDDFTEEGDGFVGHMVMVEPIKSSSNQSGNNSKGLSFEMVFTQKYGFDPLRTMIMYGRQYGMIEGNRARLKFKDDDSFTFSMKSLYHDKDTKPIWESINKFIVPQLKTHLSYIEPQEHEFDSRGLDY